MSRPILSCVIVVSLSAGHASAQCPVVELVGSDTTSVDAFGNSVALDGAWAVIGAPNAKQRLGAAYVFERSGQDWNQGVELAPAIAGSSNIFFGTTVAIQGDVVVVAAPEDYDPAVPGRIRTGSVFVFRRTKSGWDQEAKLSASDARDGLRFGDDVAVSGDRILVGARYAHGADIESGAAYVFRKTKSGWVQEARLFPRDGYFSDWFGLRLAIAGDVAVITAWNDEHSGPTRGSAYVFRRDERGWQEEAKLTASQGLPGEYFGASVATDGTTIAIGVWGDFLQDAVPGSVFVFRRIEGVGWVEDARLTPTEEAAGTSFGASAALTGNQVWVGAYFDNEVADRAGACYAFAEGESEWHRLAKLHSPNPVAVGRMGRSISVGVAGLLAGAPGENRAYIFSVFAGPDCNLNGLNDACECRQEPAPSGKSALSLFGDLQTCFSGTDAAMGQVCCHGLDQDADCDIDLADYVQLLPGVDDP